MGQTKVQFRDIHLGDHYKNQDLRRVVITKGPMYGASEVDGKILFLDPMVVIRMFTLDCAICLWGFHLFFISIFFKEF